MWNRIKLVEKTLNKIFAVLSNRMLVYLFNASKGTRTGKVANFCNMGYHYMVKTFQYGRARWRTSPFSCRDLLLSRNWDQTTGIATMTRCTIESKKYKSCLKF